MSNYDLSILIPALREEFLKETVENIIKQKRGKTEVIVGLDGEWSVEGKELEDHPDVRIVHSSKNLGQRGMTNLLAKLSEAKYVAKADAHTAYDEGFDVKLMEAVKDHDDWTIVPAMKNLHVFSWICSNCSREFYQGEKPDHCPDELCQFIETDLTKKIYFVPRGTDGSPVGRGPTSTAYRFTPDRLQFKYFDALKKYQTEDVSETMSLQGSFFMLTRDKYWELNICDETWGGWGQQGTEVALKTWLSGGRVVVHKGTWYAHMFRTNNQVAFPWNSAKVTESQGTQQHKARKACIDLFKNNGWDKQVRPLSWLVERFWDALQEEPSNTDKDDRKWTLEDIAELRKTEDRFNLMAPKLSTEPTKGILYFTDGELPEKYAKPVLDQLKKISADKFMPLEISLMEGDETRGYLTMFKQILRGLERLNTDVVFMAEHDVLYPGEHFDFTPTDKEKFYYDINWWKVHEDGLALHWDADQVSGLCAYREKLIEYYRWRIRTFNKDEFDRKFEPFSGNGSEQWRATRPHIDIRHNQNLTYNKRGLHHFRNKATAVNFTESTIDKIPGWEGLGAIIGM